jgi:putative nucleotidyltransferase with HDIG domain
MTPRSAALQCAQKLQEAGFIAYFAGGCVRDHLLGIDPHDFDIATSATPAEVEKIYPKANRVGAHFGVLLVREGEHLIEVATFRHDGSYSDGRRPDAVVFSTPEEDAQRRDFTINGLFQEPLTGRVIDHVEGQRDLAAGVLRAIGVPADRFAEDHLRMLRAVRFAARFGFAIDPPTLSAIHEHHARLSAIAPERIRGEFDKILTHPSRVLGFDLLVETGLMRHIIPEVYDLQGCEQPPQFHPEGDVFVHTRLMLGMLPDDASLVLCLAVLLHDIAKPATYRWDEEAQRIRFNGHDRVGAEMAREILTRLRYSNEVIDATCEAVRNHMMFMNVKEMRKSKLRRFMAREGFEDEMQLHRVDCLSSNGMLDNYEFVRAKEEEFAHQPLVPEPLLTGHDLMKHGWKPGPELGRLLAQISDLQLEGELTTAAEALEWARQVTSKFEV